MKNAPLKLSLSWCSFFFWLVMGSTSPNCKQGNRFRCFCCRVCSTYVEFVLMINLSVKRTSPYLSTSIFQGRILKKCACFRNLILFTVIERSNGGVNLIACLWLSSIVSSIRYARANPSMFIWFLWFVRFTRMENEGWQWRCGRRARLQVAAIGMVFLDMPMPCWQAASAVIASTVIAFSWTKERALAII